MIHPEQFAEQAKKLGFRNYAGVPCSYLASFINCVINEEELNYFSLPNEGDAVAIAAGLTLGGQRGVAMMQNSGLGNAVSPLASLTWTFRIPILLIVSLRGDPEISDEPQHKLMGAITTTLLESMQIPWDYFPVEDEAILPVLQRADATMRDTERPYALVIRKGSIASCALNGGKQTFSRSVDEIRLRNKTGTERPTRSDALQRIIAHTDLDNCVVITTTGFTSREMFALADHPNQLYMVGSMGCASSLGLGLAQARPDLRVVIVEGDGAALMRMGNFAAVGAYSGNNLVHIVLDNEVHDSTDAQATVSTGVSFGRIANACGYGETWEGNDIALLDELFSATGLSGPRFAQLKIRLGAMESLPRPDITPEQVRVRLMRHISTER